jgi:hypothetical protein
MFLSYILCFSFDNGVQNPTKFPLKFQVALIFPNSSEERCRHAEADTMLSRKINVLASNTNQLRVSSLTRKARHGPLVQPNVGSVPLSPEVNFFNSNSLLGSIRHLSFVYW